MTVGAEVLASPDFESGAPKRAAERVPEPGRGGRGGVDVALAFSFSCSSLFILFAGGFGDGALEDGLVETEGLRDETCFAGTAARVDTAGSHGGSVSTSIAVASWADGVDIEADEVGAAREAEGYTVDEVVDGGGEAVEAF